MATPSPAPAGYEPVGLGLEHPATSTRASDSSIMRACLYTCMHTRLPHRKDDVPGESIIHLCEEGEPTARANVAVGPSRYISAAVRSHDGASGSKRDFPRVQHDCHVGHGAPPAIHSLKGLDEVIVTERGLCPGFTSRTITWPWSFAISRPIGTQFAGMQCHSMAQSQRSQSNPGASSRDPEELRV